MLRFRCRYWVHHSETRYTFQQFVYSSNRLLLLWMVDRVVCVPAPMYGRDLSNTYICTYILLTNTAINAHNTLVRKAINHCAAGKPLAPTTAVKKFAQIYTVSNTWFSPPPCCFLRAPVALISQSPDVYYKNVNFVSFQFSTKEITNEQKLSASLSEEFIIIIIIYVFFIPGSKDPGGWKRLIESKWWNCWWSGSSLK